MSVVEQLQRELHHAQKNYDDTRFAALDEDHTVDRQAKCFRTLGIPASTNDYVAIARKMIQHFTEENERIEQAQREGEELELIVQSARTENR